MPGDDLQFRILGSLEFERAGHLVDLGSYKQKSLLALLLTYPNQIVSTDRILDELWGQGGTGKQNALWVHISNLRSAIEPDRPPRTEGTILLTRAPGYLLKVEPAQLDASTFERLVSEAGGLLGSDPAAAALVFAEALALWRGKALEEFTYESFAQTEITRLESLRLDAVEGRIEADLARGLAHQLVGELQGLVREHSLRERFTALLMVALYRSQRQADALRAYNQLRSRLGTELGIEPSQPLRDLEEQIILGDPRLEPLPTAWVPGGPEPGLAVRGYELRSSLGKTRFGTVYRAFQPAIGREVAIKVIRPELANDPAFIRRFEAEANLISGLESVNVVPLYDFWREPDAAFLVEKLVTGGDLNRLVAAGPVANDRVLAIVGQIARPLAMAHDSGVSHGGLGLENVLLDEDGNAYITDFGIASQIGDASPTGDIADLATIAAELFVGSRGTIPELAAHLEAPVAEVVSAATDPAKFSSVAEFVDALRSTTGSAGAPERWIEVSNPYKGLEPFDETDTGQFFGRERLVERMLTRLGGVQSVNRFLAVVGPSGSGKSSVVRAGLIPALRAGGVAGSESWFVVAMTPGVHPFESIEQAVTKVAVSTSPTLLEQMMAEPSGLRRVVDSILPDQKSPLVLVIDQFEEIYTITADEDREAFTQALVDAITHPRSRLRVIITLRADFYDRPLATPGLGDLLRDHTELVTPMTTSELERAITRPAEAAGVVVQPSLLAALVGDAVSKPGVLPMLQYTLTELFERRRGTTMTAAAYEAMGGLAGAVVERAESLFAALTPEARTAARHVFLRLVSVNEAGEATRRRALLSELQAIEGRDGYLDDMLRAFARHRLLSFDRDPASRGPTVEISHEALIPAWDRLAAWIDDARDDLRAQRRLATATGEWVDQGRNPDFLLTGASLARYSAWTTGPPVRITSDERAFLEAAFDHERQRQQAARDRLVRETQLRRRTRALAGLGALSILVVLLAVFAFSQRQAARDLADQLAGIELARQLASDSGRVISEDTDLAILLAIEAIRATEHSGEALPEAIDALHWALQAATIEYPAADESIPMAVRPHFTGPRGVFALAPSALADLGREAVRRPFNAAECTRFFRGGDCPNTATPLGHDVVIAGGFDEYAGLNGGRAPLAGTTVVINHPWYDSQGDAGTEALTALSSELGIEIDYRFSDIMDPSTIGSNPDDIVIRGPVVGDIASVRPVVEIGKYLGEDYLRDSYGDYLASLGSLNGRFYGVFIGLGAKSLIWYNQSAFEEAGYTAPSTWEGLLALSDQMVLDGHTPWCLGVQSGDASGWPATDWLETVLLRSQGPDFYDQWASHRIPVDHPDVVDALEKVGLLTHSPGYVSPGPEYVKVRPFDEGVFLVSREDPQCWLLPAADWVREGFEAFGEAPMSVMPFPIINPDFASAMEGDGGLAIAVSDRPEVRAMMRAFASPAWATTWAASDVPFIAPHRAFDLDHYTDPAQRSIAAAVQNAIDGDLFRIDASDQMPIEVGFGALLLELTEYVSNPGASAKDALASVEAAWIEYEAKSSGE